MARTTGTVSVSDLLRRGALKEGESIELRRQSAEPIHGVIQADGSIRVGKTISASPSRAARLALGARAVDGWLRWRVPRLGGRSLDDVRKELG